MVSLAEGGDLFHLDDLVSRAIRRVYDRKLAEGDVDAPLWQANANAIWAGIEQGAGKSLSSLAYTDPSFQLLAELKYNTHVLARFKVHENVADFVAALTDDEGKVRSFADFKKIAADIGDDYNRHWLRTEYDTAIGTGQMAERWKQIERDADIFPYVQYQTVGDDRVRPEHVALDGVTKRYDDPFWDQYYPPNGWRCRCDVLSVAGPEIDLPGEAPDVPAAFKNNPGKTGAMFTEDHPYFQAVQGKKAETLKAETAEAMYKPKRLAKEWDAVLDPEFWKIMRDQPNLRIAKTGGAAYNPGLNRVNLSKDTRYTRSAYYREKVIYHEFGHAAHFQRDLISFRKVDGRIKEAFEASQALIRGKEQRLWDRIKKMTDTLRTKDSTFTFRGYNRYDILEMLGATSDTLAALTDGKYGAGHSRSYWRKNTQYMEFFAHACENTYGGNMIFKVIFPEMDDIMVKLVKDLAK